MPLAAGIQLGSYEIVALLGQGGMGEVWRARDGQLDRDVAIKVLPEHLARDPDRLARFEREAKTLAQLNHPNVAGIYGVQEHGGHRYLVLEYVEGETLATRLDRGPLPLDEALEIATQVAAGVEAAHDAGVIHRDLKPGNIIITPNDQAKVLDFGLARTEEASSTSLHMSPPDSLTMTTPAGYSPTVPGVILGTAGYMSPEQARGRRVDKRTDIWSFGVILYEMLAGANPFVGETVSDSVGAVLHKEVEMDRLPASTPPMIRHVLRRCLARDKGQRYRDIGDVRLELHSAMLGGSWTEPEAPAPAGMRIAVNVTALATAIVISAIAWVLWPKSVSSPQRDTSYLAIPFSDDLPGLSAPRISSDGRRLVLHGYDGNEGFLLVRDLDDPVARRLPNTARVGQIGLSPDGLQVFFAQSSALHKMSIAGGPAVAICKGRQIRGAAWGSDGTIVLAPNNRGPLHRVDSGGGTPQPMYELLGVEKVSDRYPAMLPRGRGVLFARCTGDFGDWEHTSLWVVDLEGGQPRQLLQSAAHGRYLESGYLVFQRKDTLMAAGFDLRRLELTTPEAPVLGGLTATWASVPAQFALSPNGTLVYMVGDASSSEKRIDLVALDGTFSRVSKRTGLFSQVVPSDDGRFLAIEIAGSVGLERLAVLELARDLLRPLPDHRAGTDKLPVWSPDGKWLVFSSNREGAFLPYRYRFGSPSLPEPLVESDRVCFPEDWSGDGKVLLMSVESERSGADLAVLRLDERGVPTEGVIEPLVTWPGHQYRARFSPDDRWVVFMSTDSAGAEVFVIDASDPSHSVQVSTDGGIFAVWAPDKNRIYYLQRDTPGLTMYAVDFEVRNDDKFVPSPPKRLFDLEGVKNLDSLYMTPDGTAFIIARPVEGSQQPARRELRIVLNWDEEVRRRLPLAH